MSEADQSQLRWLSLLKKRRAKRLVAVAVKAGGRRALSEMEYIAQLLPRDADLADRAWTVALTEPHAGLLGVLRAVGVPPADARYRAMSMVALPVEASDVLPEAVFAAAVRPEHPIRLHARERAMATDRDRDRDDEICVAALRSPALEEFCVQYGMTPAEPVRRAAFLLMTGQIVRYLIEDPDCALLSRTLRTGDWRTHVRIRAAAAGSRRGRADPEPSASTRAVGRAVERLLDHSDLAGRRLIRDLPLAVAITAARRLAVRQPAADGNDAVDRTLRTLAFSVGAEEFAATRRELTAKRVLVLPVSEQIGSVAFAPDLASVVVEHRTGPVEHGAEGRVERIEIPGGRILDSSRSPRSDEAVDLGESALMIAHPDAFGRFTSLVRYHNGKLVEVYETRRRYRSISHGHIHQLISVPPGAVVSTHGGALLYFDETGKCQAVWPPGKVGATTKWRGQWYSGRVAIARDPVSGQLAAAGRRLLLIGADHGIWRDERRVIPAGQGVPMLPLISVSEDISGEFVQVAFSTAETLVTCDDSGLVQAWKSDGVRLTAYAAAEVKADPGSLAVLLPFGVAAVIEAGTRAVRFLEAATLRPTAAPVPLDRPAKRLWASARGEFLAVHGEEGGLEVFDLRPLLAGALLDLPMAAARPADVTVVRQVRPHVAGRETAMVLDALAAVMEHHLPATR